MAIINRVIITDPPGEPGEYLFGFALDGRDRSPDRERTTDADGNPFSLDNAYEVFAWKADDLTRPFDQRMFRFNPDRVGDYFLGGAKNKVIETLTINYEPNPPGGPNFLFGFNEDGSDKSISRLRSKDGQGKALVSGTVYPIFVWQEGLSEIFDHDSFLFDPDDTGNGAYNGLDFTGHELLADNIGLSKLDLLSDIDNLITQIGNGKLAKMPIDQLFRIGLGGKRITYTQGNPGQFQYRKILTLPPESLAAYDGVKVVVYGGGWAGGQKSLMELTAGNRGGFTASHRVMGPGGFISILAHKTGNEVTLYLRFLTAFGTACLNVDGIGFSLDNSFPGIAELPAGGTVVYDTQVNAPLLRLDNSGNSMAVKLDVADLVSGTKIRSTNPSINPTVLNAVHWNPDTKQFELVDLYSLKQALEAAEPGSVGTVDPGSVDPGSVDTLYNACTPFSELCSGNSQEIRTKTITVPRAGNYQIVLDYRAHEKAVNGFAVINNVNHPVQFAQVTTFVPKQIGIYALKAGENTIGIVTDNNNGYLCFNNVCVYEQASVGSVDSGSVSPVPADRAGVLVIDMNQSLLNGYKALTRLTLDAPGKAEHLQDCSVGAGDRYIGPADLQQCLVVAGYDTSQGGSNIGVNRYAVSMKRMRELGWTGTVRLLADAKVTAGSGSGIILRHNLKRNGTLTSIQPANGFDFLINGTDMGGSDSGLFALTADWKSLVWYVIDLDADTVVRQAYTGGSVGSVGTVDSGSVSSGSGDYPDVDVDMPAQDYEGTPVTNSARVHLPGGPFTAPRQQGNHYALAEQQAKNVVNVNRFPRFDPPPQLDFVYDWPLMIPFSDFNPLKRGATQIFATPDARNSGYFTAGSANNTQRVAFITDDLMRAGGNIWANQLVAELVAGGQTNEQAEADARVVRLRALHTGNRMVIHQGTIDYLAIKLYNEIKTQAGQGAGVAGMCLDFEHQVNSSVENQSAPDQFQQINIDRYRSVGMIYLAVGYVAQADGMPFKIFSHTDGFIQAGAKMWNKEDKAFQLLNYLTGPNAADPYGSSTHPYVAAYEQWGGYIGNMNYARTSWSHETFYDKDGNGNYVKQNGFRVPRSTGHTATLYGQSIQFAGADPTVNNEKEATETLFFPYYALSGIQSNFWLLNNANPRRKKSQKHARFAKTEYIDGMRHDNEVISLAPGHGLGERPINPDLMRLIILLRSTLIGQWMWSAGGPYAQGEEQNETITALGSIEAMIQARQRASDLLRPFFLKHLDYYYVFPSQNYVDIINQNADRTNAAFVQKIPVLWGLSAGRDLLLGASFWGQDKVSADNRELTYWYDDGTRKSPAYKALLKNRETFFEWIELPSTIVDCDPRYLFFQWTDLNGTLRTLSGDWHYPVVGNPTPPSLINGTGYALAGGSVSSGSVSSGSVSSGSVSSGSVSSGSVSSGSVSSGSVSGGSVSPTPGTELTRAYVTNHGVPGDPAQFQAFLDTVDEALNVGTNAIRISVRLGEWIKANGNTAKWDRQADLSVKGSRELPRFLHIDLGFEPDEFPPGITADMCQRFMDQSQPNHKHLSLEWWEAWESGVGYDQTPVFKIENKVREIINHFGPTEVSFSMADTWEFAFTHKNGGPKGVIDFTGYEPRAHQGYGRFNNGVYTTIPVQPAWNQPYGTDIWDTFGNDGNGKWAIGYRDIALNRVKNWCLWILNGTGARPMLDVGGWLGSQQLCVGTTNIGLLTGGMKIGKSNSMPKDRWDLVNDYIAQISGLLIDQEQDYSLYNWQQGFWKYGYNDNTPVPRTTTQANQVGVYTNVRRHLLRGGRGVSHFGVGPDSKTEFLAHVADTADLIGQPVVARPAASGLVTANRRNLRKNEGGLFSFQAWEGAGGYNHPVNFQTTIESLLNT